MTRKAPGIVIVGGSIAASTAADTIRLNGYEDDVTVLSDEDRSPYSRVPLSKGILRGTEAPAAAELPALDESIDIRLQARAVGLDTDRKVVQLADGETVPYRRLIVATGSRARRLAPPGLGGETVIRTMHDALELRTRLNRAHSVAVLGGGFLGMEIASSCRAMGLEVTLVDRDVPQRRLLGSWLSRFLYELAREAGVRIVRAPEGAHLAGSNRVEAIDTGSNRIEADVVITAAGDVPNVEWLNAAGPRPALEGAGVGGDVVSAKGLLIDGSCRVAQDVFACGDVTAGASFRGHERSPHWMNAVEQGRAAGLAVLDHATMPLRRAPYYWTDQFGVEIKLSGHAPADATPTIVAGSVEERSMLLQWHVEGRPIAAATVNHRIPLARLRRLAGTADTPAA